jgi:hypothetical protein
LSAPAAIEARPTSDTVMTKYFFMLLYLQNFESLEILHSLFPILHKTKIVKFSKPVPAE